MSRVFPDSVLALVGGLLAFGAGTADADPAFDPVLVEYLRSIQRTD